MANLLDLLVLEQPTLVSDRNGRILLANVQSRQRLEGLLALWSMTI